MSAKSIKLPILATLITLLAVVIMFALGLWQLERAEQKNQRLAMIESLANTSALSLSQVLDMSGDIRDLPITLSGNLDPEQYLLLDNRIHQGRVGFEVLGLMTSDLGNVMVNFGWIPGDPSRQHLPKVSLPRRLMAETGKVAIVDLNPMVSETADSAKPGLKVIQQLDLGFIQQVYQLPLLPFIVQLDPGADVKFIRDWQPVVMSPQKHFGYAIQWFGLAIAGLLIYGFALWGKIKKKEKHDT